MMYTVCDERRNFKGTLLRLKGVRMTNLGHTNDQNFVSQLCNKLKLENRFPEVMARGIC